MFESTKFDSFPEIQLARVLENDNDVIYWLRPAQNYNRGKHYVFDFVVGTAKVFSW